MLIVLAWVSTLEPGNTINCWQRHVTLGTAALSLLSRRCSSSFCSLLRLCKLLALHVRTRRTHAPCECSWPVTPLLNLLPKAKAFFLKKGESSLRMHMVTAATASSLRGHMQRPTEQGGQCVVQRAGATCTRGTKGSGV